MTTPKTHSYPCKMDGDDADCQKCFPKLPRAILGVPVTERLTLKKFYGYLVARLKKEKDPAKKDELGRYLAVFGGVKS